jgi:putative acetyltransferase
VELREELTADIGAAHDVHLRAFGDRGKVGDLVDALRREVTAGQRLALVAEDAGHIVGHVMFTRSLLDAPRRLVEVQVLSPRAVAPGQQGRGIGSALVRSGLQVLDARGVPLVFLEGDPAYYSRFGFVPGGTLGFRKPSLRIPDAAFQVLQLSAYEPWMTGTLVYSEPFWTHDAVAPSMSFPARRRADRTGLAGCARLTGAFGTGRPQVSASAARFEGTFITPNGELPRRRLRTNRFPDRRRGRRAAC